MSRVPALHPKIACAGAPSVHSGWQAKPSHSSSPHPETAAQRRARDLPTATTHPWWRAEMRGNPARVTAGAWSQWRNAKLHDWSHTFICAHFKAPLGKDVDGWEYVIHILVGVTARHGRVRLGTVAKSVMLFGWT